MSAGTLYTYVRSGNAYKVRLLQSLLGIDLKQIEIDFMGGYQHTAEFLKINPRGTIPCLVDHDKILVDSTSILVWLAGKYGDSGEVNGPSSYWTSDLFEQTQILDWLSFSNSWVQYGVFTNRAILTAGGPYNGLGLNKQWSKEELDVLLKEGAARGEYSLQVLSDHLEKNEWLALGRPTIADVSVFPYVALAPEGGISLEPYPAILRWVERVKRLPRYVGMPGLE